MNLINTVCFILLFLNVVKSKEVNDEWESPVNNFFSLPDVLTQTEKYFLNVNIDTSEIDNDLRKHPDSINSDNQKEILFAKSEESKDQKNILQNGEHVSHSYLLRIVNIILHYSNLKSSETSLWGDETTATVDLTFSDKTLKTLQRFSNGQSVPYDELDECFVSLFKINDCKRDEAVGGLDQYLYCLPVIIGLFLILGLIFYIAKTAVHSIPRLLFNISLLALFLFFFSSVGISLWGQYEDIWAKRIMEFSETLDYNGKIPDECFPNKVALHQRIYNLVTGDNMCQKYWNSRKSIFVELDFGKAFSGSFFNIIFQFLPQFGDSLGSFVTRFSGYFPWPLNWIVSLLLPVIIINSFFLGMPNFFKTLVLSSRSQGCFNNRNQHAEEYQLPPTQPVNNWYIFDNNGGDSSTSSGQQNVRNRIRMQQILKKQKSYNVK